jgi:hypothetical protein
MEGVLTATEPRVERGPIGVIAAPESRCGRGTVECPTSNLVAPWVLSRRDDLPHIAVYVQCSEGIDAGIMTSGRVDMKAVHAITYGAAAVAAIGVEVTFIEGDVVFRAVVVTVGIHRVAELRIENIAIHIRIFFIPTARVDPLFARAYSFTGGQACVFKHRKCTHAHGILEPRDYTGTGESNGVVDPLRRLGCIVPGCFITIHAERIR